MSNLSERLSFQDKNKPGCREYHIAYYVLGFMSNKCLVGKHIFWGEKDTPIDKIAHHGFLLSMGPYQHKFKRFATGWNFIYEDLTDYDQ